MSGPDKDGFIEEIKRLQAGKRRPSSIPSTALLGGTSLTARDCYVIGLFCDEVERMAERNMLKTGKLEGAHYAAMRQLRATFPTPNAALTGRRRRNESNADHL